jgi:hypothetical protein
MYKEKIIDVQSGEVTWRDYSAEEIAEVQTAQAEALAKTEEQAERTAAKDAAIAKLAALGLTTDDLKALGLGGN